MKIILKALFLFFLSIPIKTIAATSVWEVAVVFLGVGEDADFQADIDKNILELARTEPNSQYRLAILRDYSTHTAQYIHSPKTSSKLSYWDPLFFKIPQAKIQIPGEVKKIAREPEAKTVLDSKILKSFFDRAFELPNSRRILVVYGHGEGFQGLRAKKLLELHKVFENSLSKKLDILWFDSCFMGSIEVLYQLRNLANFFIASQDAEFSVGAPFDSFSDLQEGPDDVESQARNFATRFVESYSFIKEGAQTGAVGRSSATVSVVRSDELEILVELLKKVKIKVSEVQGFIPKIVMDKNDLVDLGMLLKNISITHELESLLELNRIVNLRTNPRVLLRPKAQGARVVFGYENWTRGDEKDPDILERLPTKLTPTRFVKGPKNKNWPSREINKRIWVAPFMPGIQVFNYFFLNGRKAISSPASFKRANDFVIFTSNQPYNPVSFAAYTQSVGARAEKYSGLNVANPTLGIPTTSYLDTDFYQATRWGSWQ